MEKITIIIMPQIDKYDTEKQKFETVQQLLSIDVQVNTQDVPVFKEWLNKTTAPK